MSGGGPPSPIDTGRSDTRTGSTSGRQNAPPRPIGSTPCPSAASGPQSVRGDGETSSSSSPASQSLSSPRARPFPRRQVGRRPRRGFAVGFGRELLGFTRGETRYSLNLLPLGGYVKMLGQEDFAVDRGRRAQGPATTHGSFTSNSVGKRMVIVSAGVIMNLLFAAVAFTVVTMIGRNRSPPSLDTSTPTSAACVPASSPATRSSPQRQPSVPLRISSTPVTPL